MSLLFLTLLLVAGLYGARRLRRRPRPDYLLIRRVERDVFGEALTPLARRPSLGQLARAGREGPRALASLAQDHEDGLL